MMDKRKMGKRSRAQGKAFELRVRKDLEEKGWICDRWSNNVSDFPEGNINMSPEEREDRKLVAAKSKFRGVGIPMMLSSGFPDFIAFKRLSFKIKKTSSTYKYLESVISKFENRKPIEGECYQHPTFNKVIGVEAKINGTLDKLEKEKCQWLLDNHIFSKILIASKTKVKNKVVIEYKEFK